MAERIVCASPAVIPADPVSAAVLAGYDPAPCPYCGQLRAVHSGTRHACDSCGARWVIAEEPLPQPDILVKTKED